MINQQDIVIPIVTLDLKQQFYDAAARQADRRGKCVTFKNCAPFINFKSEINNTEIDHAKDIDIVVPMYSLIEYSDNYSKTSGSLSKYYKDKANNNSADSESFK